MSRAASLRALRQASRIRRLALAAALLAGAASGASGAEPTASAGALAPDARAPGEAPAADETRLHHEHTPLDLDAALTLNALLERTFENFPRYIELEARAEEAKALERRASSLLGARPALMLEYRSDERLSKLGLREYDYSVALPLWRQGQRRAAGALGESAGSEARAAADALRWDVAGRLREALWDLEAATNDVALAQEELDVARELERSVAKRHEAGDLPLEDALLARSTVLEREAALAERRAALVDAERAYEKLTGLKARPLSFAEPLTKRADYDENHPRLALAAAEVERARAELALAETEAAGKTVLTIGPRRQRDPLTNYYADSFGVGVSVPFGGRAQTAPEIAAARRRLAEAEARRTAVARDIEAAMHEAVHTLEVTETALGLARERSTLASRRWHMGRVAFEQGEIPLPELLRREEAARGATREVARLEIQRGRTIAEINQAVGELP